MKRSRNMGLILALGGIVIVIIGFLVISGILNRMLAPPTAATAPPPITEKVVITTHDIPLGSVLNAGDLVIVEVPVELVPSDALSDIGFATGRMTKIQMVSGEMVLANHLADPTNLSHDLAFVLEDDQVLMAFPATDLMSRINLLQQGDLVDVLASIQIELRPEQVGIATQAVEGEAETEKKLFTFSALQRITISGVIVEIVRSGRSGGLTGEGGVSPDGLVGTPQPTPTPSLSEVEAKAILLALSPQDALVLKHLKDAGATFDIVLRAPSSSQIFDLNPVSQDYLIDRYNLEIIR